MPSFVLGDNVLPVASRSWWTKAEEVPLQILAQQAPYHCYVEKLHYWNVSPRAQRLALCPFNVDEDAGIFSTGYNAEKTGAPCSFATVPENTENTLQVLELTPPLLLRRNERIGMWDQENGSLAVVSTWRRTFGSQELGYFQASSYHFQGPKKLKPFLTHSTSWFASFRRLTDEEKQASKSKKKKLQPSVPVLALASKEEYAAKLERLERMLNRGEGGATATATASAARGMKKSAEESCEAVEGAESSQACETESNSASSSTTATSSNNGPRLHQCAAAISQLSPPDDEPVEEIECETPPHGNRSPAHPMTASPVAAGKSSTSRSPKNKRKEGEAGDPLAATPVVTSAPGGSKEETEISADDCEEGRETNGGPGDEAEKKESLESSEDTDIPPT